MPVEQPEPPANLRQRLMQFTLSEVEAFCHDLGINPQLLRHQKLDEFVLDVLGHCQRRPGFTERLTQLVEQAEAERAIPPAEGECPYKGLQAYEEADAHLFFGREKLTQELVDHLQKHNFLAVVGASGSGKSSVVKAGVIPHLRKDNQWLIVPPFRPGANPFEQLALHLLPLIDPTLTPTGRLIEQTKLSQAFVEGTLPLSKVVYQILQNNLGRGRLLLVVDQFEELFTNYQDKQSQQQWLAFLTEPLNQARNQLTLLFTLRADFYGYAIQSATLKPLLQTRQVIVPLMAPAELEEAITRPAGQAWQFQDGLVATILEDVAQEPGGLPFLSQALLKTWEKRQGRQLTLAGYLASGGVKEAISQTAEQVYNQLSPPAQEVVRGVLLRLTQLGEGREDTRRRLTRPELAGLPYPPELVQEVLDKLTAPQVRLLTQDQEVLEVAHEALIRGWPLLRQWLDEDREGLRLHRQLTDAAGEWERLGRDKSLLWRGARLAQVEGWGESKRDLTHQEREFLAESTAEEARIVKEKEATRQRVLGISLGATAIFICLSLVSLNYYLQASWRATELTYAQATTQAEATRADQNLATSVYNEQKSQHLANLSKSLELIAISKLIAEDNPINALLLSIEGFVLDKNINTIANLNEQLPLVSEPILTFNHGSQIHNSAIWSSDNKFILTTDYDGFAKIWNANDGSLVSSFEHGSPITMASWNFDDSLILTVGNNNIIKIWNTRTGVQKLNIDNIEPVKFAIWNPKQNYVLSVNEEGTINLWDVDNIKHVKTLKTLGYAFTNWTKDGLNVLTLSSEVNIWDVQSDNLLFKTQNEVNFEGVLKGYKLMFNAQLNNDETLLLTKGTSSEIWDIKKGLSLFVFPNAYDLLEWSPSGKYIVATGKNNIDVFGTSSKVLLFRLYHEGEIIFAQWNPNETFFITGSKDGVIKIWSAIDGRLRHVVELQKRIKSISVSPDNESFLLEGINSTITIYNLNNENLKQVIFHENLLSYSWDKNGSKILTTSSNGTIKIWDINSKRYAFYLNTSNIAVAKWSHDKSMILTESSVGVDAPKYISTWSGKNGKQLFDIDYGVNAVYWNLDKSEVLIERDTEDKEISPTSVEVWNYLTSEYLYTINSAWVFEIDWNLDKNLLLISGHAVGAYVEIWNTETGNLLSTYKAKSLYATIPSIWVNNNQHLLIEDGREVKILNQTGEKLIFIFENQEDRSLVGWNEKGYHIAVRNKENNIDIWDWHQNKLIFTIENIPAPAKILWGSSHLVLLTGNTAKVFSLLTGKYLFSFELVGEILFVEWDQKEKYMVAVGENQVMLWDMINKKLLFSSTHTQKITSTIWNFDQTKMAIIEGNIVSILDFEKEKLVSSLNHTIFISSIKWNRNGSRIWTQNLNNTGSLWDVETGKLIFTIEGDGSDIVSTEWSEDESQIWIVTENGLVRSYYTDPKELIVEACSRATRNLTWEEWQTYLPGRPYRQTCPNLPVHESVPESERP